MVPSLRPGTWTLGAVLGGQVQVTLEPGQRVEVQLQLAAGMQLEGRIHAGGMGLADVKVQACLEAAERRSRRTVSTRSDLDGRYALALPGGGEYTLHFQMRTGPWVTRPLSVSVGDTPRMDVDFGTGCLAGRIVDVDQRPLPDDLSISITRDGVYAGALDVDSDGRFTFTPLSAGNYLLKTDSEFALPSDLTVELASGELRDDVEFVLPLAGLVWGTARVAGGAPFVGYAHLRRIDGGTAYYVAEIEQHEFEFPPLEPGGWRLDLATFPEPLLGPGEGRRGEPGAALPWLGGTRFQLEALQSLELEIAAEQPASGP